MYHIFHRLISTGTSLFNALAKFSRGHVVPPQLLATHRTIFRFTLNPLLWRLRLIGEWFALRLRRSDKVDNYRVHVLEPTEVVAEGKLHAAVVRKLDLGRDQPTD